MPARPRLGPTCKISRAGNALFQATTRPPTWQDGRRPREKEVQDVGAGRRPAKGPENRLQSGVRAAGVFAPH